jgi:isomaltose glucohydrolase
VHESIHDEDRPGGDGFAPDESLVHRSAELIRRLQQPSGAYPASPTFSAYRGHCWFRDGAFIAEAARRHGDVEGSARFHRWCARTMLARRDRVADLVARGLAGEPVATTEMLPTRYTYDGADGTDAWWDFQLDGYGTWLWALGRHSEESGPPDDDCTRAAALVADYLAVFWHRPCYDWWEEHVDRRHVSTLGAVRAGLAAVLATPGLAAGLDPVVRARVAGAVTAIDVVVETAGVGRTPSTPDGRQHLVKWLGGEEVDSSLLACLVPFALPLAPDVADATLAAVEAQLTVEGGVHRYLNDTYYGGGQWLLLSGFLAWVHASAGRSGDAAYYLRWIESQAGADGGMPEQVRTHLLAPDREQEWIDRWGPSASPLLWSHAMYLIAVDELRRRSAVRRGTEHNHEDPS